MMPHQSGNGGRGYNSRLYAIPLVHSTSLPASMRLKKGKPPQNRITRSAKHDHPSLRTDTHTHTPIHVIERTNKHSTVVALIVSHQFNLIHPITVWQPRAKCCCNAFSAAIAGRPARAYGDVRRVWAWDERNNITWRFVKWMNKLLKNQ